MSLINHQKLNNTQDKATVAEPRTSQDNKIHPSEIKLFYNIPKKPYTRFRKPLFTKKLPNNTGARRNAKKFRRKKMNIWLKFKKDIDYFEEQHETLISYIEKDFLEYEKCCELYNDQNKYYDPELEDSDIYKKEHFYKDTDYYRARIEKHYDFHKILSDIASEKGIYLCPLPFELLYELDSMIKYEW